MSELDSMTYLMGILFLGALFFLPAAAGIAELQARRPATERLMARARLLLLLILPVLLGFSIALGLTWLSCGQGRCVDQYGSGYYAQVPICGASYALAFALTTILGYALARRAGARAALHAAVSLCLFVAVFGIVLNAGSAFDPLIGWLAERKAAGRTLAAERFDCSTVAELPPTECRALVAIYLSTNGPDWNRWVHEGKWLESATPCSWSRVSCEGGHVTEITVGAVSGSLPADIRDLPFLSTLDFDGGLARIGGLTGAIPPQVGELARLERLDLFGNKLTGAIPPQLGKLERLTMLSLGSNQLSGEIPPELGNLPVLEYLSLYENHFSGPLPRSLLTLKLTSFHYDDAGLCVPRDAEFQEWLSKISKLTPKAGSETYCE